MTDLLLPLLSIAVVALTAALFVVLRRIAAAPPPVVAPVSTPEQQQLVAEVAALKGLVEGIQSQTATDRQTIAAKLDGGASANQQLLTDLRERIAKLDAAQENIGALQTQVTGLVSILGDKKRRGRFGEVALEELVMDTMPKDFFEFQAKLSNGKLVDCLIRLGAQAGTVAIDSKFPLEAYQTWADAIDEAGRDAAKKDVVRSVKKHVDDIADKYIVPGDTRELALMFIPAESIYSDLLQHFDEVLDYGYQRRVYVTSPNSLHGMLTSIRAFYVQTQVAEQSKAIQREVRMILNDVRLLDERVDALGKHFKKAAEDIGAIETSSNKITRRGEKIATMELTAGDDGEDELPPVAPPLGLVGDANGGAWTQPLLDEE